MSPAAPGSTAPSSGPRTSPAAPEDAARPPAAGPGVPPEGPAVRVCIDLDTSWRPLGGRLRIGVRRSPLHSPASAAALAREIVRRPRLRLVGVMAYEAHIAGLGDDPPGRRLYGAAARGRQRLSGPALAERRAAAAAAG